MSPQAASVADAKHARNEAAELHVRADDLTAQFHAAQHQVGELRAQLQESTHANIVVGEALAAAHAQQALLNEYVACASVISAR